MADRKVAYQKHWFVILALVFESILLALFLEALLDENSIWRDVWLVLCPLVGVTLGLLLVPPIFTSHALTESGLRLRMGFLVNQEIPFDAMDKAKETTTTRGGLRLGVGTRYLPITRQMFVTSAFSNLVSIHFSRPVRMGVLHRCQVEEIILSVSSPRTLLDSLEPLLGESGV